MTLTSLERSFLISLLVFLALPAHAVALPQEAFALKQAFPEEVGASPLDSAYEQALIVRAGALLGNAPASSQYFLLVDRNAERQTASLALFDGSKKEIAILGTSKTSTGDPKRRGHFETPIGIFKNTPSNMSYRALGTKNSKGWRGLGAKGSRIWDLGWQRTNLPRDGTTEIRLLVHATDPDFGELRLGKQDSKGCIRIPATFNRFLDRYGILDAEYERSEKARYVLRKDRSPAAFAGSLVVVVDSAQ